MITNWFAIVLRRLGPWEEEGGDEGGCISDWGSGAIGFGWLEASIDWDGLKTWASNLHVACELSDIVNGAEDSNWPTTNIT